VPRHGAQWRLGHRPALDGIRGLAVALVVVSHTVPLSHAVRWFGLFGVTVFFTLSGFLITALLLEEHHEKSTIHFGAFYARRARRLLPALLATVLVVVAIGSVVDGFVHGATVVGALTYLANVLMLAGVAPTNDALGHTWSLAVEEQFYVLWPLLLLALLRLPRPAQRWLLLAAVAVTAVLPLQLVGGDTMHAYYGTDVHAMPLLLGASLGWFMHRRPYADTSRPVLAAAALAAMLVLGLGSSTFRLYLAPQVVAGLTAVMIWAAVRGPGVAWLEGRHLVRLGQLSYGLYLIHFPLIVLFDRWLDGPVLAVVALSLAWVLTLASWRYVELPARRWRRVRPPAAPAPYVLGART